MTLHRMTIVHPLPNPPRRITAAIAAAAALLLAAAASGTVLAAGPDAASFLPAITVTGSADVAAAPDRARISLGAVVESRQAVDAQKQLAQIMRRVLSEIKGLEVPDEQIRTAGLSLTPVYSQPKPRTDPDPEAPRIVGYRATSSVTVQMDDMDRVGAVIDAGIAAGANQLTGLAFELKDDLTPRRRALQLAAQEARLKAETIAAALDLTLGEVVEVHENGAQTAYPVERRFAAPAAADTLIQPGQVQVRAAVTIRFRLIGAEGGL